MTREEAAEFTRKLVARAEIIVFPKTPKRINNIPVFYFEAVLSALRGPQPDPKTGLVPCGCGGGAVRNGMSFFCAYVTSCSECGTLAWSKASQQEADNNWNTAMGRASE